MLVACFLKSNNIFAINKIGLLYLDIVKIYPVFVSCFQYFWLITNTRIKSALLFLGLPKLNPTYKMKKKSNSTLKNEVLNIWYVEQRTKRSLVIITQTGLTQVNWETRFLLYIYVLKTMIYFLNQVSLRKSWKFSNYYSKTFRSFCLKIGINSINLLSLKLLDIYHYWKFIIN